jgi:aspartyl-tRNA(Asn)/glutamyl-tRNA(Gln) amidotransferase subunit A
MSAICRVGENRHFSVKSVTSVAECAAIVDVARAGNARSHIYTQLLDSQALRGVKSYSTETAPLQGVPVAIKDNIDVAGADTSCGRRRAIGPAAASAAIVQRLESLGAILIGKTNLDEAALGASGRNLWFGRCDNPRFVNHLSGGSSSGSAAAVAAGHVSLGIGTDTLGSVRIPAAFCGVAGFKPSHGRLPIAGVTPLYPRYDSVGLLAATLADLIEAAEPLLGEAASRHAPQIEGASPIGSVSRIDRGALHGALQLSFLGDAALATVESDVARDYRRCVELLRASHGIHACAAPLIDWRATAGAALWEVAHEFAERSAGGVPGYHSVEDIDGELRRFLTRAAMLPLQQLSSGRSLLLSASVNLRQCLQTADAVLTPTCPHGAPRIDEELPKQIAAFVAPANVAGLPAVAWPQRLADHTVSLQLIGRFGDDLQLLRLASQLQQILDRALATV